MSVLEKPSIDTIVLDESLLDDTLRCQGGHPTCTVEASHLIVWCQPDTIPVCDYYVLINLPKAVRKGLRCGGCERPIGACWNPVPV